MKKLLLALLLLCSFTLSAARTDSPDERQEQRRQERLLPRKQIQQLHNGALLVRLKTKSQAIAKLHSMGYHTQADQMRDRQADFNKKILQAFRQEFSFCPVYFFFSEDLEKVIKKELKAVQFLNDSLQVDTTIHYTNPNFLTADFGPIEQDTASYFDKNYMASSTNGIEMRSSAYGGPSMGFEALLIRSEEFIQLRRPFPYYERTYDYYIPFKIVVKKMNAQLQLFYVSEMKKQQREEKRKAKREAKKKQN